MKKIKSLIARTIKNLGKLTAFALLILPAFAICCLLGSWTLDNNGNLVGENIWSGSQTVTAKTSGYTQEYTLRPNTDYYLSYSSSTGGGRTQYRINGGTLNTAYGPFTFTTDGTGNVTITLTYVSYNVEITYTYIMLNEGTSAKPWEPHGVYYSQTNYDNIQTQKYNEGYGIGYNDGYEQASEDVINQYAIPIVEGLQIQQVVIHAEDSNNTDLGRISYSIYEDRTNNELELSNINNITGSTKNVIEIYLINNLQLTEFKATEGFYAVILGNQRLSASYDGTNYIIPNDSLLATQVVNIIRIEIPTTVRAVNYIIKGSNLSVEGTQNAYETGLEIGKQQQLDEDTATITQLQTQYDTLLEHYNSAQLDNPLSKMVIAVADIPLNLFHNMFNFDIMGFNIAAFILGIITILLVAYVIKLFVK